MSKKGPPVHPNKFAWKPNAGVKINETEVGGKFRPLSEVTGVCPRCKDQIEWKRKYGKYKPLSEPAKCQRCSKRAVRQAYHNLCTACAKEQKVCAKCSCRVDKIIGRDRTEVEAEQKMLEEAIKNARERDRRTLLRTVNKGKSNSSTSAKSVTNDGGKAGELFAAESLEEYAEFSRDNEDDDDSEDQVKNVCEEWLRCPWEKKLGLSQQQLKLKVDMPMVICLDSGEKGTHRIVRQSPFNAKGIRQTSFSGVEIMPLLPDESMAVEIFEDDLDISFSRAGGKGGQNVNKVETAVRITHIPIGVAVRCTGLHYEPFDQESMNNIHM